MAMNCKQCGMQTEYRDYYGNPICQPCAEKAGAIYSSKSEPKNNWNNYNKMIAEPFVPSIEDAIESALDELWNSDGEKDVDTVREIG
jgi:hypothetical protein